MKRCVGGSGSGDSGRPSRVVAVVAGGWRLEQTAADGNVTAR